MVRLVSLLIGAAAITAAATGCASNGQPEVVQPGTDEVRLLAMTAIETKAFGEPGVVRAFVQPIGTHETAQYRFELYEFMPLNANPRGKRLILWPSIEPGEAELTNTHWRQHLKAYEFTLPLESALSAKKAYLLEVTSLGKDGTRRSDYIKIDNKVQ